MMHRVSGLFALTEFAIRYPELYQLARLLKSEGKTYLSFQNMLSLVKSFLELRSRKGKVNAAEFGVGRGGSAMLLYKLVNKYGGSLVLFDVFGTIPPPSELDGIRAAQRFKEIEYCEGIDYYGKLPGLKKVIEDELRCISQTAPLEFVEGLYQDTLSHVVEHPAFDLVHIDCDWYESTKAVLRYLRRNLSDYAILQIDDYSFWPGCKLAVEEAEWLGGYGRKAVGLGIVITVHRA